jgi:hypothetical protein
MCTDEKHVPPALVVVYRKGWRQPVLGSRLPETANCTVSLPELRKEGGPPTDSRQTTTVTLE